MTTADFETVEAATAEVKGRSLWADAWRRLLGNRAAVVSAIILGVIAVLAVLGPLVSPHGVETVYRSYIKVPPSLEAYPKADSVPDIIRRALRRSGADVTALDLEGERLTLTLSGPDPIDERVVVRPLSRAADLTDVVVAETRDGGRTMVVEMNVVQNYFLFGTDSNGRDLLTRILSGGQISLMIGLLATLVSLVIGVTYGATAGYIGGRTDNVMMRIVDILYSIPFMFFVILLMVFFGRNIILIFIAVGAIEWLDMARIVRGQTLSVKRKEFIEAAHACGVGTATIIRRHVVPNTLGPVVVYMTLMVPKVILLESFLSFLGLGVQEPQTSWGVLISEGSRRT